LNPRPADYESAALPLSYLGPLFDDSIRAKSRQFNALGIVRKCVSPRKWKHRPADPNSNQ
jgi:hypothetical protein